MGVGGGPGAAAQGADQSGCRVVFSGLIQLGMTGGKGVREVEEGRGCQG